jgi:hypothetical protein
MSIWTKMKRKSVFPDSQSARKLPICAQAAGLINRNMR